MREQSMASFSRSRNHLHRAELPEVMIEGKGVSQSQLFDQHFARAIGEALFLVIKSAEDRPGEPDVCFREPVNFRQRMIEEPLSEAHSFSVFASGPEERQGFIHGVVGGEQRLLVRI